MEADAVETESNSLQTQLAAVELLLRRRDRDVARSDIVLATVLEILELGDRTTASLHTELLHVWPGISVTMLEVEGLLGAAEEIHHVAQREQLGGQRGWTLLPAGKAELEASHDWASDVGARFKSQLYDEARHFLGAAPYEDVQAWFDLIVSLLRRIIAESFSSREEAIDFNRGRWLAPVTYDLNQAEIYISGRVSKSDVADFLRSALRLALDPSSAFGSELVHHLVTGHLLYVFMATRKAAEAQRAAGGLAGETLILDTPVLFHLTRPSEQRMALVHLIATALNEGVQVVLFERTIREFDRAVSNSEEQHIASIQSDLEKGASPTVLADLSRGSDLIRNWLLRTAGDGGRPTWTSFVGEVNGANGPRSLLQSIGVEVRQDTPSNDIGETSLYEDLKRRLAIEVSVNGHPTRSPRVIEHDAAMLLDASRSRKQRPASSDKIWPGSFVLTTDNHLNEAFDQVFGEQLMPVALSFAGATALIAAYASPNDSEDLAFQVADELTETAIMSRSTVIPLDLARELAMGLAAEDIASSTDLEQLQLNVCALLREQPDFMSKSGKEYREFVGTVVTRRRERLARAREQQALQARDEENRAALADTRREAQLEAERTRRREVENELDTTKRELAAQVSLVDTLRSQGSKKAVVAVLTSLTLVSSLACFLLGRPGPGSFLLLASALSAGFGWGWATNDSTGWPVTGAVLLSAIAGIWGLFF